MSSLVISGDTSGTVTLAAPAVSGTTTLTLPTTSGTIVTGTTPSGTIVGTTDTQTLTNKTLTSPTITGASITVASTAAPAFSAYRSGSAQSISSNTYVKVQLNTEDFDTANCFDSSTNYRFTPTVAGYYQINGSIVPDSSSSFGNGLYVVIYKNGSSYRTSGIQNTVAPTASIVSVSAVVYCNGTTDYIELYGYSIGGVGMSFATSYSSTAMSGSFVRSA